MVYYINCPENSWGVLEFDVHLVHYLLGVQDSFSLRHFQQTEFASVSRVIPKGNAKTSREGFNDMVLHKSQKKSLV